MAVIHNHETDQPCTFQCEVTDRAPYDRYPDRRARFVEGPECAHKSYAAGCALCFSFQCAKGARECTHAALMQGCRSCDEARAIIAQNSPKSPTIAELKARHGSFRLMAEAYWLGRLTAAEERTIEDKYRPEELVAYKPVAAPNIYRSSVQAVAIEQQTAKEAREFCSSLIDGSGRIYHGLISIPKCQDPECFCRRIEPVAMERGVSLSMIRKFDTLPTMDALPPIDEKQQELAYRDSISRLETYRRPTDIELWQSEGWELRYPPAAMKEGDTVRLYRPKQFMPNPNANLPHIGEESSELAYRRINAQARIAELEKMSQQQAGKDAVQGSALHDPGCAEAKCWCRE